IEELNQAAYVLPRAPRIAAKFDDADSPNEVEAVMSGRGFQLEFEDEARFLGNSKGTLELKIYTQAIEDPNAPTIILRFRPERLNAAWQAAEAKLASIRQTYAQGACLPQRYEPPPREGCFLTTAAVETIGLADDCWELRTLRAFRDNWLVAQPDGATDVAQYYAQAPAIAQSLRADPKRLSRLYFTGILPSAIAARMGLNRLARSIYSHHMRRLAPLAAPLAA
ncbi:MAG: CFI-box-CTERM domain-containing protein, partial [Pseudomonadota bacterium]